MWQRSSPPHSLRRVEPPAIEHELVARDEPLDVRPIGRLRPLRRDGAAAEVDRVERLLDVQWPRFAVAVDAVPIEQPKRRVAGLLDLGDQQAGAERVDGAGFEKMQSPTCGSNWWRHVSQVPAASSRSSVARSTPGLRPA